MAKITRSSSAPEGDLTFSVGEVDFALTADAPEYDTTNPDVIAYANLSHLVDVEETPSDAALSTPDPGDQSDPHVNPAVDVLSNHASKAALEAAGKNLGGIFNAVGVSSNPEQPKRTVAEGVAESLGTLGVTPADAEPAAAGTAPAATPTPGSVATEAPTVPTNSSPAVSSGSASSPTTTGASS